MRSAIVLFCLAFVFNASAEEFDGKMFSVGKINETPLYIQKVHVDHQPDGTTITTGEMLDAAGNMIMSEHVVYSGSTFISQEIQNNLDHKEYRGNLKDKKMTFEVFSMNDGEEKKLLSSKKETVRGPMLSGVTTENFIRENWETLMKGKRVDFRFAVFERQETIGFSFKKKTETDVDGKSAVVLTMRPTSFFVSLVVDPMEVSVEKEGKTIIHFKGRTPIVTDKKKNLEAEIVYERLAPSISRATASQKAN